MNRVWLIVLVVASSALDVMTTRALPATQLIQIDLTQSAPLDIATIGDDPFGKLAKYGHLLFTDTAKENGPAVSDPTMRFAGNNLACQNCHLQAGSQRYAVPLIGIWGQFPQYPEGRARSTRWKNGSTVA
jgi:thiosulfate dehydrogenase